MLCVCVLRCARVYYLDMLRVQHKHTHIIYSEYTFIGRARAISKAVYCNNYAQRMMVICCVCLCGQNSLKAIISGCFARVQGILVCVFAVCLLNAMHSTTSLCGVRA